MKSYIKMSCRKITCSTGVPIKTFNPKPLKNDVFLGFTRRDIYNTDKIEHSIIDYTTVFSEN